MKNDLTRCVVPLHPTPLAIGFIELIQRRRRNAGANRPPRLRSWTGLASGPFLATPMTGSPSGNHRFQHQLEDRIRDAQLPGQPQAYTGRKRVRPGDQEHIETEGSESAYGQGHTPAMMPRYAKTLAFEGVALPPPFGDWLTVSIS